MVWLSRLRISWLPVPDAFLNAVSTDRKDAGRRALAQFVKDDAHLHAAVLRDFGVPVTVPVSLPQKTAVARTLTRYAMKLAENDEYLRAASALLYALLVVPDYLEAVAGMAILYHAWEDQIAGRWAEHFRDLTDAELPVHSYLPASEASVGVHTELLRAQMWAIITECKKHPEWRDSSADLQRHGMEHHGRYGT